MAEETNLNSADSGGLELESSESKEDVSKAEGLESKATPEEEAEYYQKLTGREDIKSKADFEKHYEGLKSLVGDQSIAEMRKKAEAYEKVQQEIEKEADEFLESEEGKETAKEFAEGAMETRVSTLEGELKTERFLKTHPEAQSLIGLVKAKADRNKISLEDAYTKTFEGEQFSLKELLGSKLEAEKAKEEEKSIGVESKSRMAAGSSAEISQLMEEVRKTDSATAKQKLVEKVLGLSEK